MDHERETAEAEPPSSAAGSVRPLFPPTVKERERIAPFPQSERSRAFRRRFFPDAAATDWNDWRWQLRNRIRDMAGLARVIQLSADEHDAVARHSGPLPVGITPYYASLLSETDPMQPLRRTQGGWRSGRVVTSSNSRAAPMPSTTASSSAALDASAQW